MTDILVLYYSGAGAVKAMAQQIALGIGKVEHTQARLRTVPMVGPDHEPHSQAIPASGDPYVSFDDLRQCTGMCRCRGAQGSARAANVQVSPWGARPISATWRHH